MAMAQQLPLQLLRIGWQTQPPCVGIHAARGKLAAFYFIDVDIDKALQLHNGSPRKLLGELQQAHPALLGPKVANEEQLLRILANVLAPALRAGGAGEKPKSGQQTHDNSGKDDATKFDESFESVEDHDRSGGGNGGDDGAEADDASFADAQDDSRSDDDVSPVSRARVPRTATAAARRQGEELTGVVPTAFKQAQMRGTATKESDEESFASAVDDGDAVGGLRAAQPAAAAAAAVAAVAAKTTVDKAVKGAREDDESASDFDGSASVGDSVSDDDDDNDKSKTKVAAAAATATAATAATWVGKAVAAESASDVDGSASSFGDDASGAGEASSSGGGLKASAKEGKRIGGGLGSNRGRGASNDDDDDDDNDDDDDGGGGDAAPNPAATDKLRAAKKADSSEEVSDFDGSTSVDDGDDDGGGSDGDEKKPAAERERQSKEAGGAAAAAAAAAAVAAAVAAGLATASLALTPWLSLCRPACTAPYTHPSTHERQREAVDVAVGDVP